MKIYVAGHNQQEAKTVAAALMAAGHTISSTWVYGHFAPTDTYSERDRVEIADRDVREVMESDCLVLIPSAYRVPGGKFIEVGVAIGGRLPIAVLGARENMLMWHSTITAFTNVEDLLKSQWWTS